DALARPVISTQWRRIFRASSAAGGGSGGAAARTPASTIRAPGPVPVRPARSIPFSAASFRAAGLALMGGGANPILFASDENVGAGLAPPRGGGRPPPPPQRRS